MDQLKKEIMSKKEKQIHAINARKAGYKENVKEAANGHTNAFFTSYSKFKENNRQFFGILFKTI